MLATQPRHSEIRALVLYCLLLATLAVLYCTVFPSSQRLRYTSAMTNWGKKMDADDQSATVVVLSVNDVYDMHPDEHGRGGIAEFATLLERERAAVPANATLLVTLNGDFMSGSEIGERCKGCVGFIATSIPHLVWR